MDKSTSSCIFRLFSDSKEKPPQYDEECQIPTTMPGIPTITSKDIPQWDWTNSQCREWLHSTLITTFTLSSQEATKKVLKFRGNGATMYSMPVAIWVQGVGNQEGAGIYAMILGMADKKGGLPSSLEKFGRKLDGLVEIQDKVSYSSRGDFWAARV